MNLGLTRHRDKWWIANIDPKPHKRVAGPYAEEHPEEYETGYEPLRSRAYTDWQETRIFTLHGFSKPEQFAVLAGLRQAAAQRLARAKAR